MTHEIKAGAAALSGQASVIRAADDPKADLQAEPAVLRATIHIKRRLTGFVETYELTGTRDPRTDWPTESRTDEADALPQGTPDVPAQDR